MANWSHQELTERGEQLHAKLETGKTKLKLTKIKIGSGTAGIDALRRGNDLSAPKLVIPLSQVFIEPEDKKVCTVTGVADSNNVEESFQVKEMGLYAEDPDAGEILYMVAVDTTPDVMPNRSTQPPITVTYSWHIVSSNAANITATVSPAALVTNNILERVMGDYKKGFDGKLAELLGKITPENTGGIVAGSLDQNGWVKFANGLILQWGRFSTSARTNPSSVVKRHESGGCMEITWRFPVAFPKACVFCTSNTHIANEPITSTWLGMNLQDFKDKAVFNFHKITEATGYNMVAFAIGY